MIPENKVKIMWQIMDIKTGLILIQSELLSHQSYIKGELDKSFSLKKVLSDYKDYRLNVSTGNGHQMNTVYIKDINELKEISYGICIYNNIPHFVSLNIIDICNNQFEIMTDGQVISKWFK